jgi:hypothetical protein
VKNSVECRRNNFSYERTQITWRIKGGDKKGTVAKVYVKIQTKVCRNICMALKGQ